MAKRPEITLPDWAVVGKKRLAHIERVVHQLEKWAGKMAVGEDESGRWVKAALLHDAVKDASHDFLKAISPSSWSPGLRHGPAAATLAEENGESDRGVLDAVRYHSVGWKEWDDVGRMLYMADFLEPGRKFRAEHRRKLSKRVPEDPQGVLIEVCKARMEWAVEFNWVLPIETVEFWNSLVADSHS